MDVDKFFTEAEIIVKPTKIKRPIPIKTKKEEDAERRKAEDLATRLARLESERPSDDWFDCLSSNTAKKKLIDLPEVKNPILYTSHPEKDPVISVVASSHFRIFMSGGREIDSLKIYCRFLKSILGETPFQIVYAFTHDLGPNVEDPDAAMKMAIDFPRYIPAGSVIISFGTSALRALTRNVDLNVWGFYDTTWNKSWFFAPLPYCWVFPIVNYAQIFSDRTGERLRNFHSEFMEHQTKKALSFALGRKAKLPDNPEIVHVDDPNSFLKQYIGKSCKVCWDLETSGLHFMMNEVICLTLTFDGKTGYYLPWSKVDPKVLEEFFRGKWQIGANLKFDCKFMRHRKVSTTKIDFDTLNAGHCLNEMRSNSLKTHAFLFTPWGGYDDDLENYKKKYPDAAKDYSKIPVSILRPYAVMDVIVCWWTYHEMQRQLENDPPLLRYYYEDVVPSLNMYLKSELRGLDVDWDQVRKIEIELKSMISAARQRIINELGRDLNLDSDYDLGYYIEHTLKWPVIERNKGGSYKVGKDVMLEWKKMGYKLAASLAEYKSIVATYRTFVGNEAENTGIWQYRAPDGRVYPTFSVMLAKSGRNRSSGPNFQNIPARGRFASLIRSMFKAPSYYDRIVDQPKSPEDYTYAFVYDSSTGFRQNVRSIDRLVVQQEDGSIAYKLAIELKDSDKIVELLKV